MRWLRSFPILQLLAVAHAFAADVCTPERADYKCRATQNYVLVIDNSLSMAAVRDGMDTFLERFVNDTMGLDAGDPLSPKVGIVTFNGGRGWSVQESLTPLPDPSTFCALASSA